MSNEINKTKHSKRRHNNFMKIAKQVKIAKSHGIEIEEPHRLAKKHATNCGNSNCVMCGNPRKFTNEKTIQERKFEQIDVQTELICEWNELNPHFLCGFNFCKQIIKMI